MGRVCRKDCVYIVVVFFFSSRRRHTRLQGDWSSDVCSSDLVHLFSASPWQMDVAFPVGDKSFALPPGRSARSYAGSPVVPGTIAALGGHMHEDRKSVV